MDDIVAKICHGLSLALGPTAGGSAFWMTSDDRLDRLRRALAAAAAAAAAAAVPATMLGS